MSQTLELSWWLSFFPEASIWWLFCFFASLAALPLCFRMFRGLVDRGASLSPLVGVIMVTYLGWWLAMESPSYSPRIWIWRLFALIVSLAFIGGAFWMRNAKGLAEDKFIALLYPGFVFILIAVLSLPHGWVSGWLALLLLAGGSAAAWWGNVDELKKTLQRNAYPFLIAQLLFLIGFLFFVNVRSYIPFATFEVSLYQAEKWGNLTHLGSIMASEQMPPKDLWWNTWPTNYYYGGHLLTATIAKATGYDAPVAFNLGLATIFGLTLTGGFAFVFSLIHLTSRKFSITKNFLWHSGVAWGLVGALAIATFGNLDSIRQLMTREMDFGVKFRIQKLQEKQQEDWKVENGLPASTGLQLYAAVENASIRSQALPNLYSTARRLELADSPVTEQAQNLASQVESRYDSLIKRYSDNERVSNRQAQDELAQVLFSSSAKRVYQSLTSVNAVVFQEKLFDRLVKNKPDELANQIRSASEAHAFNDEVLPSLLEDLEQRMNDIMESPEYRDFKTQMTRLAQADPAYSIFNTTAEGVVGRLNEYEEKDFPDNFKELAGAMSVYNRALANKSTHNKIEQRLYPYLTASLRAYENSPREILDRHFGSQPPVKQENPDIKDHRFGWYNASFIDFWAPSRAIKSSPDGNNNPGTITEFPYFSAMLGDHHPHHFALPFTLCALCACLSLLKKNSRLKRDDIVYIRRSWPELITMAFFIGSVFAVNIWDAVVLAPLYAVAILVSLKDVYPSPQWRWVGLAGFLSVMCFLVALVYNTVPGSTPLFQNFKFLALAVLIAAAVSPIIAFTVDRFNIALLTVGGFIASIFVLFVGTLMAPGAGGAEPVSQLSIAVRDSAVYTLLLAIAASWTMGNTFANHRWWYMGGSLYAVVGGLSLFVILPFKLFFDSPLQPSVTMFWELLPPIISDEIINSRNFWDTVWKASPVNPFQEEIRTRMSGFLNHWGLFVIPITGGIIARYITLSRISKNGFAFMVTMLAFGIAIFARNYLGFWPGALSLAFVVFALFFAVYFRSRADGPAWVFIAVAFFWTWFVEALHFDDDYAGYLERYNTPFKIYYPLWPMFAGGMIVSLRLIFGRFPVPEFRQHELIMRQELYVFLIGFGVLFPWVLSFIVPSHLVTSFLVIFWILAALAIVYMAYSCGVGKRDRWANFLSDHFAVCMGRWPAVLASSVVLLIGMHYFVAATMTRTHEFGNWPRVDSPEARLAHRDIHFFRTLDGIEHYRHFDKYRQDYKAMVWARENLDQTTKILELPGKDPYSSQGRISTGSGKRTIISWQHHEHQWRGRARPAPLPMKAVYIDSFSLNNMNNDFRQILEDDSVDLNGKEQNILRLSENKERLERLREHFPQARLNELYRLREAVKKNDVSMMMVGDKIWEDAADHYRISDEKTLKTLWSMYGTEYVVVAKMERDEYGRDLKERFESMGFEEVFDSSADENLLPQDGKAINDPTYILKVPEDFLSGGGDS